MSRYTYDVVTTNGHGIHAQGFATCAAAKKAMVLKAAAWPLAGTLFEIQRVKHLPGGGRRYSLRQRSRWTRWGGDRDAAVRHPDWSATSTSIPALRGKG